MFNKQRQSRKYESRKYKKGKQSYSTKSSSTKYTSSYKPKKSKKESLPKFNHDKDYMKSRGENSPRSFEMQKQRIYLKRLHIFYTFSIILSLVGLILSLIENILISICLFSLLLLLSLLQYIRTRD